MKQRILVITTALLSIGGCSSVPSFSEHDTHRLINELSVYAPVDAYKEPVGEWIQPSNKNVACRIYEADSKASQTTLVLWDGECESGYAHGLGREMLVKEGKSLSAIGKYPGGKAVPTYYLHSLYDSKEFLFGDPKKGAVILRGSDSLTTNQGAVIITAALQPDGVKYAQIDSIGDGATILRKDYPTGYALVIKRFLDPAVSVSLEAGMYQNERPMGLTYARYRNGAVQVLDVTTGAPRLVTPHSSYYQFLGKTEAEITARTNEAKQNADEAMAMVSAYRTSACSRSVNDFDQFAHYKDICDDDGELKQFNKIAQKVAASRDERFARVREGQRAEAERIGQLQAANAARQSQELSNLVNSFNQTAASFNQSGQSALKSVMGNSISTVPNFGVPQSVNTYCYQTGNITNCKSR
ncbi:hypothetical protein ACQKIK_10345 [Pseudomonas sp. NPDC047961]